MGCLPSGSDLNSIRFDRRLRRGHMLLSLDPKEGIHSSEDMDLWGLKLAG